MKDRQVAEPAVIETPSRMEPCLLSSPSYEVIDLVTELTRAAEALGSRLPRRPAENLADLVRIMNCYYSNLIEKHTTTPREIEQALDNQFDADESRRNLQIEARAHIRLQREIDRRYAAGSLPEPTSVDFINWLHASFYEGATDAMLVVRSGNREIRMTPGVMRNSAGEDVEVGRHIPPPSDRVAAFMDHFSERYRMTRLGVGGRIMAIPAAHHRFNFIHPFIDGNGRVSRLMAHAMALHAGIGAHGLWSVSRGLARGIESRTEYKLMMAHADTVRQGDLDGRGNLSERALTEFTIWFLRVCLDQVSFMTRIFELDTLASRLRAYVVERGLPTETIYLLEYALTHDDIPRGEVAAITRMRERTARNLLGAVTRDGILRSDTPKGPISLRFPVGSADILFPTLFGSA